MLLGMVPVFYMSLKKTISFIMVPHMMHTGIDVFVLMAIPFFILAGNLMNSGGITRRLLNLADAIVGHIRGGLSHVNIIVSIIFGGMTGAATSDTAAIGSLLIPAMIKAGYSPGFSAAVTAASSTVAPIIPPSIAMVIYSLVTGVSIKKLFIAGFVPGLLLGFVFIIVSYYYAVKENYPKNLSFSFSYLLKAFKEAILPLLTPVILLGGFFSGIVTVTEAAFLAVLYAFILGLFVYKEISFKDIPRIFLESGVTAGGALFIVATARVFAWMLSAELIPQKMGEYLIGFSSNATIILLIIGGFVIIVGCFMETMAILLILTPIFYPVVSNMGIDPVHFGLIMVLAVTISLFTPPVGLCLFVASAIAKISLEELARSIWLFCIAALFVLLLIILIPQLSLVSLLLLD